MRRKILLGLLCWSLSAHVVAAESERIDAKMVGGAFKALAKGYVATVDIEKLKKDKIARIGIMQEAWFKAKYSEVYPVIKELPAKLKEKYGVSETMTKAHAVQVIRMFDKRKLFEIIENIPDRVIMEQFKAQLSRDPDAQAKGNLQSKISRIWGQAVAALGKGAVVKRNSAADANN